jgi:hypothetical protein
MSNKFWYRQHLFDSEIMCYEKLDTIDLESELISFKGSRLRLAMESLEDKYELTGGVSLFNAVSEYDFHWYLNRRYGEGFVVEEMASFIR